MVDEFSFKRYAGADTPPIKELLAPKENEGPTSYADVGPSFVLIQQLVDDERKRGRRGNA